MTHSIHDRVALAAAANAWAEMGRMIFRLLDKTDDDADRTLLMELASVCAYECDKRLADARALRQEMEVASA